MLNVKSFTFNPFQENSYILYNEHKNAIIVDPGMSNPNEVKQFFSAIEQLELNIIQIVNTHCHIDHILGVEACKKQFNCPFSFHEKDQTVLDYAQASAQMYGIALGQVVPADYYIRENEKLKIDGDELNIFFTPGHSPGSICLYHADGAFVIAGDLIFMQSVGRTDLPGGNTQQLINSIQQHIFTLPDNTRIYSGHGPETSVGSEKMNNPFVGSRA